MDINYLFILYIFLICISLNLNFFFIAYFLKSDIFTDITYALTFFLGISIIFIWKKQFSIIQILLYLMVICWSIRIGVYLFIRILKMKKDNRFDNIRNSFFKFLGFWILQSFSVFFVILPSAFFLTINKNEMNNNFFSYIFIIFAFIFLIYETIADLQKSKFYKNKKNNQFIKNGLWKSSRHPNYFGEIMFWWCLSISGLISIITKDYKNGFIWIQTLWLISPLYLTFLINCISGVPMLEKKQYKKLQNNKEYIEYIKNTSIVIPFIGKKNYSKKLNKNTLIN